MIKAALPAYVPEAYLQNLLNVGVSQKEKEDALSMLVICNHEWIKEDGSYIPAGTVELVFHPLPQADMVSGQVSAMYAQIEKIKAESSVKVMQIQEKISNLQALEYSK